MPSIKDVAERAGVSITTVSRVMNQRGYISKETVRKVEKAMEDLSYAPNQAARALQKKQSFLIGLIVPDSAHPFFADLIKEIELYFSDHKYSLLVCNSLGEQEKEQRFLEMLRQNRLDGVIMCSHTLDVGVFQSLKMPIVSFDRTIANHIPSVGSNNFRGGELATEHLIERGCRNLLHIAGSKVLAMHSNRRGDAFLLTCMKHGVRHELLEGAPNRLTFEYYREFLERELPLARLADFDGIFCSNDLLAYALLLHAGGLGINVPEQLRIVGYDDHSFSRMLQSPRLTTIRQPTDEIGRIIGANLLDLIEQERPGNGAHTTVEVSLVVGETT